MVSSIPSWQSLQRADVTQLPGSSQRLLLEALCRAASANPETSARDATLRLLIAPLPARLGAIAQRAAAQEHGPGASSLQPGSRYAVLHLPKVMVETRMMQMGAGEPRHLPSSTPK